MSFAEYGLYDCEQFLYLCVFILNTPRKQEECILFAKQKGGENNTIKRGGN
jgi:hypothetical protein